MSGATEVKCRDCGYEFDRGHRKTCPRCLVEFSKAAPLRPGSPGRASSPKVAKAPDLVLDPLPSKVPAGPDRAAPAASAKKQRSASTGLGGDGAAAARNLIMGMALGALAVASLPDGAGSAGSAQAAGPPTVAGLVQAVAAAEPAPPVPLEQLEPAAALRVAFFDRKSSGYGFDIVRIKLLNPGPGIVQELEVFATGVDGKGEAFQSSRARATGQFAASALALVRIDVPPEVILEDLVVRHWSEQVGSVSLHTPPSED